MKLIIEIRRGSDEDWRNTREIRHETEIGWDAGADDYVEALAAFMFARTFAPETIAQAFRDYAEEWDIAHEGEPGEDWEDFDEESGVAEAGEKTAPDV